MERCGFFNANVEDGEYDRVYLASSFAAYFASFIGNGVYAQHSNQLQVIAQNTPDMSVLVSTGQAWINGYWYENTDNKILHIDVADGVLSRIDSIVLCLGTSERDIWAKVKKGAPSANPVAPTIERSADYYELLLATVSIPAGATNVTQARITDMRSVDEVCGWVTGVIEQFDFTHLFDQFTAYFNEFKEGNQADYENWTEDQMQAWIAWIALQEGNVENWTEEQMDLFSDWYSNNTTTWTNNFNDWFQNVRDQLSEDVAGHLQNLIDEHEVRLTNLEEMVITGRAFAPFEASSQSLIETNDGYVFLLDWDICPCQ